MNAFSILVRVEEELRKWKLPNKKFSGRKRHARVNRFEFSLAQKHLENILCGRVNN